MLPDYLGAMAVREERLAANERAIGGHQSPGRHSLIEQLDLRAEVKLHELAERRRNRETHHWHWPHPLAHR